KGVTGMPKFVDEIFSAPTKLASDTQADQYLIDGVPLVPICVVSSSNTRSGSQSGEIFANIYQGWAYYRPEVDDGNRYFFRSDGYEWVQQTPDGHLRFFGDGNGLGTNVCAEQIDAGTQQQVPAAIAGTSYSRVYRWNLCQEQDATSNNNVYY